MQCTGNLVDRVGVERGNHRLRRQVGEERDLAPVALADRPVGAAQDDVGLDADLAQFLHRVLRRFGLHLAGRRDVRDEREVDIAGVVAAERDAHLPDRLEKRQRFDVADRAPDLHHGNLGLDAVDRRAGQDPALDLVGDVRNHLDGAAEVVAPALLADHALVDLAGREIVAPTHLDVGEALVVSEVEVGLGAVFGDEHLAVLERTHRSRIDVDVRVELQVGDADAAGGEDCGQRRGGDALPQGGNDAAGDEHELGHGRQVPEIPILQESSRAAQPVATGARSRIRVRATRARRRSRASRGCRRRSRASPSSPIPASSHAAPPRPSSPCRATPGSTPPTPIPSRDPRGPRQRRH